MPNYIVRNSVDYSLQVEADNPEHARKLACATPTDEWDQAVSELEVEDEDGNQVEE